MSEPKYKHVSGMRALIGTVVSVAAAAMLSGCEHMHMASFPDSGRRGEPGDRYGITVDSHEPEIDQVVVKLGVSKPVYSFKDGTIIGFFPTQTPCLQYHVKAKPDSDLLKAFNLVSQGRVRKENSPDFTYNAIVRFYPTDDGKGEFYIAQAIRRGEGGKVIWEPKSEEDFRSVGSRLFTTDGRNNPYWGLLKQTLILALGTSSKIASDPATLFLEPSPGRVGLAIFMTPRDIKYRDNNGQLKTISGQAYEIIPAQSADQDWQVRIYTGDATLGIKPSMEGNVVTNVPNSVTVPVSHIDYPFFIQDHAKAAGYQSPPPPAPLPTTMPARPRGVGW